jgi:hypothetical protein
MSNDFINVFDNIEVAALMDTEQQVEVTVEIAVAARQATIRTTTRGDHL